ncbi:uncharacterized protein CEXT_28881 [Caerostris extrusa]|uniref:MATH domain-containing protein n=1 Tax=Caerostris extrusa TaxID=172846 RepID=A0AAV4Y8P4_CAEEX|nr:uncharacterized protein CEXT_28881 [Caerostris extrusa]
MYRRDSVPLIRENLKSLWKGNILLNDSSCDKSFRIVWRITNFSMCKLKKGEYLDSPKFVVEWLENTNWFLRLFPKGDSNGDGIMCYLLKGNNSEDYITITYALSIGISKNCIKKVQTFGKYSNDIVPAFASLEEVLNDTKKYPLVDILLVDCQMWKCLPEQSQTESITEETLADDCFHTEKSDTDDSRQTFSSTMDEIEALRRKIQPYPESCSIYTRIPVEKWYFMWPLKRFSDRQPNQKETITVASVSENAPIILISFYVTNEDRLQLDIQESSSKKQSFSLKCRVLLFNLNNRFVEVNQDIHLFTSDEIWEFPLNICKNDIFEQEYLYFMNDELILRCEFALSYEKEVSNIDSCNYVPTNAVLNNKSDCMHITFKEKKKVASNSLEKRHI